MLLSSPDWDTFLDSHPSAHLLQTALWGELKTRFGWQAERLVSADGRCGAQVLFRRLPLGYSFAYLPKGPLGDCDWVALLPELDALCQQKKAAFLKVEPDAWEDSAAPDAPPPPHGFRRSAHSIQPRRTLVVNLRGDDEAILGRMKQKTRYNIKLALKKGVIVRPSSDVSGFYQLMSETGVRDRFGVHSQAYYRAAYELFHPCGACELLVAEYENQPLAALMVFAQGERAWYFYGASSNLERDRMPTYLLQWEAMRWAKGRGCEEYDLWGVPDMAEADLEAQFADRSGELWGVYRFKRGFGGELRRAAAAWDRVYQPALYAFYSWWRNRSGER